VSQNSQTTLGGAILDALATASVPVIFGLPGVHNLPLWSALRPDHPRILGVRHEQTAVYAADGYARATGQLGVAVTTTGPGAANGLAAFGEAASCGSPILVIASDVSAQLRSSGPGQSNLPRGILHEMADQAALFAAFADRGVVSTTATDATAALDFVLEAIAAAQTTPTAPRYLGVPSDLLAQTFDSASMSNVAQVNQRQAPPAPKREDIAALTSLLDSSKRVVLWAGGGVVQCGTEGERVVAALADRLGSPIVTSYAARGILANHPGIIATPVHEPEIESLIAEADLLVGIGTSFDAMNTRNWRMPLPPRIAVIGLDPMLERTFSFDVRIAADLVTTIDELLASMGQSADASIWNSLSLDDDVRARLRTDERVIPALDLLDAVSHWPEAGAVVCDMAVAGYWVGGYAQQPRARRLQYPVGWGTLGFGMPAAMGPAAVGIPTLAVCGDGGPMFALGELATMAQENLPMTLLIVDDGGYGMLRFDQQVFGHPERGVDLVTPDWSTLAEAFGIPAVVVHDWPELGDVLAAGAQGPRLVIIRARLFPPKTTSPRWFEGAD
jgi:thiamine pyrophosphate-dependent acetolactate synthase large subunit-like protein